MHPQGPVGQCGLRGRAGECAVLDDLVSAIRHSESRSLLLQGEAGIGKTALLDHLVASASDLTVVRARGVGAGDEDGPLRPPAAVRSAAGLEIPAPQRQAIEVVFGLSAGERPGAFFSGWRC